MLLQRNTYASTAQCLSFYNAMSILLPLDAGNLTVKCLWN